MAEDASDTIRRIGPARKLTPKEVYEELNTMRQETDKRE